jgi:hypothetical protein
MMMLDILIGLGMLVFGAVCWTAGVTYGRLTAPKNNVEGKK